MDTFKYSINPKKPIRTIYELGLIRTSKTLDLTKDQVLECLKYGSVYRRFNAETIVRVSALNLDRLHNETFMTESEYELFLKNSKDLRGKVFTTPDIIIEETKEEVVEKDFNVESLSPEIATNIEEAKFSVDNAEDFVAEAVVVESEEKPSVEEAVEPVVTEETGVIVNEIEEKSEQKQNNKTVVNYSGNKKKH